MVRDSRSRDSTVSRSPKKKLKEVWWEIKDIIDEDPTQYLVKWEPDSITGKEYPASWVPKKDVTPAALEAWNTHKQRRLKPLTESGRAFNRPAEREIADSENEDPQASLNVLVPILNSQFPREDYATQVWSQSQPTSSQHSRLTDSWLESSQESSVAVVPLLSSNSSDGLDYTLSSLQTSGPATSLASLPQSTRVHLSTSPGRSNNTVLTSHQILTPPASRQLESAPPIYHEIESSSALRSSTATCTSQPESIDSTPERLVSHSLNPNSLQSSMATSSSSGRFNPAPSPPMQDRVRSIRNSALSSQSRRSNGEGHVAVSSRASSVVSESPAISLSDARLDVRTTEIAAPYHQMDSPPEDSLDASVTSTKHELILPTNNDRERFVSLPLPSRVRDQYYQTILYFKKDITAFLAGATDEKSIQAMHQLVRRLNNVSTHVDLENEPTQSQHEVPAQDEAKWAMSSSNKFVYLQKFLNQLRIHPMHVAIVAGQTRLREILARFLQGIDFNYSRTDTTNSHSQTNFNDPLKVTIASGVQDATSESVQYADAIVMLDSDVSLEDAQVKALRTHPSRSGLSPVIYPLVYCSAEHLSRCIDQIDEIASEEDKLKALITAIDERQQEVGAIDDDEYQPDAAAEETAYSLFPGATYLKWTVGFVRPVKVNGLERFFTKSQTLEDESVEDARNLRDETPNIRKRAYEDDSNGEAEQPKRQRLTPATEPSRISDATPSAEAQMGELQQALENTEKTLAEKTAKVAALEVTIRECDEALRDYRKAMDDLQARFEKTKRGMQRVALEHGDLVRRMESKEKQLESTNTNVEKLKDDVKRLEADLQATRSELLNSAVPELAETERLRQSNRDLSSGKDTLERKIESITRDFEFTREQYQVASEAAKDEALKARGLEEEITRLKQKASGEAARLREMTDQSESETHVAQLRRLRLENDELREQLRKKERGRGMTTRTGSVAPRSPRLAPSPGRSRAGSRAPGSRPGSPVRSSFGARKGRTMVEQAL